MGYRYCAHLGALPADHGTIFVRYCRACSAWEAWADLVTDNEEGAPGISWEQYVEGGPFDGPRELADCLRNLVAGMVAAPGAPWDRGAERAPA